MKEYNEFAEWLNQSLADGLPKEVVAVNFNLSEGTNEYYIQFIGAGEFDEDDTDWACDEVFSTDDDFVIARTPEIQQWENGLTYITQLVSAYLENGKYASLLKKHKAVGIGFVDGDLEILYKK